MCATDFPLPCSSTHPQEEISAATFEQASASRALAHVDTQPVSGRHIGNTYILIPKRTQQMTGHSQQFRAGSAGRIRSFLGPRHRSLPRGAHALQRCLAHGGVPRPSTRVWCLGQSEDIQAQASAVHPPCRGCRCSWDWLWASGCLSGYCQCWCSWTHANLDTEPGQLPCKKKNSFVTCCTKLQSMATRRCAVDVSALSAVETLQCIRRRHSFDGDACRGALTVASETPG